MITADDLEHPVQGGGAPARLRVDEVTDAGARVHGPLPAGRDGDVALRSLVRGEEVDAVEG
eukprot:1133725-Alexandrium_andersonii.AAC.1